MCKKAQHVRVDLAKISLTFVSSAWIAVLATESDMVDVVRDKLATFKTSFTCKKKHKIISSCSTLNFNATLVLLIKTAVSQDIHRLTVTSITNHQKIFAAQNKFS